MTAVDVADPSTLGAQHIPRERTDHRDLKTEILQIRVLTIELLESAVIQYLMQELPWGKGLSYSVPSRVFDLISPGLLLFDDRRR